MAIVNFQINYKSICFLSEKPHSNSYQQKDFLKNCYKTYKSDHAMNWQHLLVCDCHSRLFFSFSFLNRNLSPSLNITFFFDKLNSRWITCLCPFMIAGRLNRSMHACSFRFCPRHLYISIRNNNYCRVLAHSQLSSIL